MNTNLEIEQTKLTKSSWLCPNCIYSGNCMTELKAVSPIYYCEEHFIEARKEVPLTNHSIKAVPIDIEGLTGLCASCSAKSSCTLRSEERIIFNCEHYH